MSQGEKINEVNLANPLDDKMIKVAQNTLINYSQIPNLSESIINLFLIAASLFLYGLYTLNLVSFENNLIFTKTFMLISGIIIYIIGIYDWYKGHGLCCIINFSYGLLFINYYVTISSIDVVKEPNDRLQGTFYVLILVLFLTLMVGTKNEKTLMLAFNLFFTVIGFVFLITYKYLKNKKRWVKTVYGYSFLIDGGLFWITGLMKFFNFLANRSAIPIVDDI